MLFFHLQEQTMGIFSNILSKIFPANHPAIAGAQAPAAAPPPVPSSTTPATAAPPPAALPMPEIDVEQILAAMAAKNPEKLNWKTSIVDLMKLLGLDSSFAARKQLATELGCPADKMGDS